MSCNMKGCSNTAVWRPIVKFFAAAPSEGFFTAEIGMSVCPACKATLKLEDLCSSEFEMIAIAALRKAKPDAPAPDLNRTQLEWIPLAEAEPMAPARPNDSGGGPVAEHIFVSDDPAEIAGASQNFALELTVVHPAAVNFAGLERAWCTTDHPPAYHCAECGGPFIYPLLGGPNVGVCVFAIVDDRVQAMLLHAKCWAPRCVRKK